MNRRGFISALVGVVAVEAIPPSQVWPFRKIFVPPSPRIFEWPKPYWITCANGNLEPGQMVAIYSPSGFLQGHYTVLKVDGTTVMFDTMLRGPNELEKLLEELPR